jgi:teichoic acid transport system permease protein
MMTHPDESPDERPAAPLVDVSASEPLGIYLRDVWRRREYLLRVPADDLRGQNFDTVLGNLWHLLNPLLQIAVYYLVFGLILDTNRGVDNFIAFLAVGVFTYQFTQKAATQGAKAITSNEGLIRSLRFPRVILPLTSVLGEALAYLPGLIVMFAVAILSGESPSIAWLLVPVGLFPLQLAFNVGLACLTARANDVFHDVENLLPFVFRIAFYMSGVIFSVEHVIENETLRALFVLNPIFCFISLGRAAVLHEAYNPAHLLSAGLWTVGLLLVGFTWFRAGEHTYGRG